MCKHTDKKLSFVRTFIPDWFKTQQMHNKAVLENGGMLELFPYKTQKMCDQAADSYARLL